MEMDKEIYLCSLYDYYGVLLTDKQKEYFEDYYFNNLSLSEIAENNETSRNAIHKQIKETENKLLAFEDKLKLCQKYEEIKEVIKDLPSDIKEQIEELL
ncbi:MAG: hypothetical protein IKP79_00900 [Bacilli bacterium]|nr:hypothetical protein [Bacilli bacterium]